MKRPNSSLITILCATALMSSFAMAQSPVEPAPAPAPETKTVSPFDAKKLKGVDQSMRRELSDEEIQQQFFKTKEKSGPSEVFMPVFYEHMSRALARLKTQVTQNPGTQSTLELDARAMLAVLTELVVPAWMDKFKSLKKSCDSQGDAICLVPVTAFADPDVKIEYVEAALEIRIHVPPDLRAPRSSSLFRFSPSDLDEPTDQPSSLSTYINANAIEAFRSDSVYKDTRDPLGVHFDSGTRIGPMVIEANAHSLENRPEAGSTEPVFTREDVRAVMDFPRQRLRAQAGDLVYPVKGFQVYRPMGGVTMFTQFNLQSSQLTLPGGNYEVFLARPSKVIVFINEQPIQTLDLPAGRHNLRDFPFNNGLNDLRLEIMDDLGRREVQRFTYFSNSELLKPGLNEVTYAVGKPSEDLNGQRAYTGAATVSASHRLGVSQWFTLGLNVQHDPLQNIVGMETLFSTRLGFFSFEPAYSTNSGQPNGYAGRFRYILQEYVGLEKSNRFSAIELDTTSNHFAQLGIRQQSNPQAAKIQATHTRSLSKRSNINLNVSYQLNRATAVAIGNSFSLIAGVTNRWTDGLSTNLGFRHTSTAGASDEIAVMGFLIWAFTAERQFVTASYDSGANSERADWTYQPSLGVGGFTTQANVQKKETAAGYGGNVDYVANRGRFSIAEDIDIPKADPNASPGTPRKSINATNLRAGMALVFAGGHFALSRPVTDSFAILFPMKNLEGQNAKINPQMDESYIAQTDWLGPAVDPELPSYSLTSLQVGQKNLKQGTTLPHDHFLIRPPYHAGYAIEIGSDATVYFKTVLLKPDGKPGEMLAGQAIYLDDPSKEPVTIFTNRTGLVRSEGFRHGRYRLEVPDYEPVEFTIPESALEEYTLDAVKLKSRKP